jgi:hypothetical protein
MNNNNQILNIVIPIIAGIIISIYVYIGKTPELIKNLFNNSLFRIVYLSFLFIYRFDKNPTISLTLAIFFMLTIYFINRDYLNENIGYVYTYHKLQKELRNSGEVIEEKEKSNDNLDTELYDE